MYVNISKKSSFLLVQIQTTNKETIGEVKKKFKFVGQDTYRITFPGNLDAKFKAAVIGACILVVSFL